MTTVIVVAIVALVFFVTVSVVTFMTWKRETEMRTDSLKGIENCLNEVLHELAGENAETIGRQRFYGDRMEGFYDSYSRIGNRTKKDTDIRKKKSRKDPFSWVRAEDNEGLKVFRPDETQTRKVKWTEVPVEEPIETPRAEGSDNVLENLAAEPEINDPVAETPKEEQIKSEPSNDIPGMEFSFVDLDDIENIDLNEIDFREINYFKNAENVPADYNTGRSGRRYTAEELESLIKE